MNQPPSVKRVSLTRRMEPTQIQRSSARAATGDLASLEACLLARPSPPTHSRPTTNSSRALIRETLALSSQDLNDRRSWVLGCRVSCSSASLENNTPSAQPLPASPSPTNHVDASTPRCSSSHSPIQTQRLPWNDAISPFPVPRSSRPSTGGGQNEADLLHSRPVKQASDWRESSNSRPLPLSPASGYNMPSPMTYDSTYPVPTSAINSQSSIDQQITGRPSAENQSSFNQGNDVRSLNLNAPSPIRPDRVSSLVTLTRDASLPNLYLRPPRPAGGGVLSPASGTPSSPSRNGISSITSSSSPSSAEPPPCAVPVSFSTGPASSPPMPSNSRAGVYWPRMGDQQKLDFQEHARTSGELSHRVAQMLDQSCSSANPEGDSLPFIFHLAGLLMEISHSGGWSKMAIAHELAKVVCRERNGYYSEAPLETQLRRSYIVYETFALALTSVFASPISRHVSCYSTFIHANTVKQWQVPPNVPDGDSSLDQVYSFIDFHRTSLACHFLKATQGPPEYGAHIPHLAKIIEMLVTQGPESAQSALVAFLVASRTYFKLLAALELPGNCDLLLSLLGVNPLVPSSVIATQIVDALERQCFSRYHTSVNRSQSSSTLGDDKSSSSSNAGDLRDGSKSDEGGDNHSINFYTAISLAAKDTIARWRPIPSKHKQHLVRVPPTPRRRRHRFLSSCGVDDPNGLTSLKTETRPAQHFPLKQPLNPLTSLARRQEWASWSGEESSASLSCVSSSEISPCGEWKSGGKRHKRRKLNVPLRFWHDDAVSAMGSGSNKSTGFLDDAKLVALAPRRRAFSVDAVWLQSEVYPSTTSKLQRSASLREPFLVRDELTCDDHHVLEHGERNADAYPTNERQDAAANSIPEIILEKLQSLAQVENDQGSDTGDHPKMNITRSKGLLLTSPLPPRTRWRKRQAGCSTWPPQDPERLLPSSHRYLIALSRFLLRLLDGSIAILASLPSLNSLDVDDVRPLPSASSDSSEPRHPQLIMLQRVFSSSLLDHMARLLTFSCADQRARDTLDNASPHKFGLGSSHMQRTLRRRGNLLCDPTGSCGLGAASFLAADAFLNVLSELSQAVASPGLCLSWSLRTKLLQIVPNIELFLQFTVRHICHVSLEANTLMPSHRHALSSRLPLKTMDCINHMLYILVNLQASENHLKQLVLSLPTVHVLKILFVSSRRSWELARIRSGRLLFALIKRLDRTAFSILKSRKFMTLVLERLCLALNGESTYFCCLGPSLDFLIQLLALSDSSHSQHVSDLMASYPQWVFLKPVLRFKLDERPSIVDPSSMVPLEETRKLRDFRKLEERTERARRQLVEASQNKDTDHWQPTANDRTVLFPRLQTLDPKLVMATEKGIRDTPPIPQLNAAPLSASPTLDESKSKNPINTLSLEALRALQYQSVQFRPQERHASDSMLHNTEPSSPPLAMPPHLITGLVSPPYVAADRANGRTAPFMSATIPCPSSSPPSGTGELSFRARASRSLQLVRQVQQR